MTFVASIERAAGESLVRQDLVSLQAKARRVFGEPPREDTLWSVQQQALQQSTPLEVARLKASWFGEGCVLDICCGLGGDLLAIARRGPAVGVDREPSLVRCATENLAIAGLQADVRCEDVLRWPTGRLPAGTDWIHVDPDRRPDGRRHTRPEDFVPPWTLVRQWLGDCRGGLVKLAPATSLTSATTGDMHRTWISLGGRVREQTCVAGELLDRPWLVQHEMRSGGRSAIVLREGRCHVFSEDSDDSPSRGGDAKTGQSDISTVTHSASEPVITRSSAFKGVGRYLVDPDPSIRASGLTLAFAAKTGCRTIAGPAGFLTVDADEVGSGVQGLARSAEVLEVVPAREKKLRHALRTRDAFADVIKARGSEIDPDVLQRRLRSCGSQPLGVWIGRGSKGFFAAITTLPS